MTDAGATQGTTELASHEPAEGDREVLTWDGFGTGSRSLAAQVADDGFRPDMVLAIARGGLAVAGALSYALGVKNCFTMNVEYYTGVDQRRDVPVILPPVLDPVELSGLSVLVADDVADTGHTLALVQQVCEAHVADVRCAVLYQKPRSVVRCEYVWRETDRWIDFPWSSEPPLAGPGSGASRLR
jgi:hypothetical protein